MGQARLIADLLAIPLHIGGHRASKLADVPRLPFKLALKIGNHKATLAKSIHEDHEADVVRLLSVLHDFPDG